MKEKLLWVWFSKIEISNKTKLDLLCKFKNLENIWKANLDDFIFYKIADNSIKKIMDSNIRKNLDLEYNFMLKNNINIINFKDKKYPKKLLEIENFPICLYYIGNIKILKNRSIGMVGSRKASDYGKKVAREISKQLSDLNINIISGLAIGVDKYSHLGCLDSNKGKTIAILGTGVDRKSVYPFENLKVYDRIIENGGVIISEYPINTKPFPYHFPARNRIISALSDKIIVVEANQKSGSLITVDFALEQGKEVWAVPRKYLF